jgi:hypothetical protein
MNGGGYPSCFFDDKFEIFIVGRCPGYGYGYLPYSENGNLKKLSLVLKALMQIFVFVLNNETFYIVGFLVYLFNNSCLRYIEITTAPVGAAVGP